MKTSLNSSFAFLQGSCTPMSMRCSAMVALSCYRKTWWIEISNNYTSTEPNTRIIYRWFHSLYKFVSPFPKGLKGDHLKCVIPTYILQSIVLWQFIGEVYLTLPKKITALTKGFYDVPGRNGGLSKLTSCCLNFGQSLRINLYI